MLSGPGADLSDEDPAEAARWRAAKSLPEIGALTAEWLEGSLAFLPSHGNGPDAETASITATLARLNRAGFVTDCSQPGEQAGSYAQRAFVTGYCDDMGARRLERIGVASDLIVLLYVPAEDSAFAYLPLGRDESGATLWGSGAVAHAENIEYLYRGVLHDEGVEALLRSWQFEVIDPVWGRVADLWAAIEAELAARAPAEGFEAYLAKQMPTE